MGRNSYIAAYWVERREDCSSCVRRAMSLLNQLSGSHGLFAKWYRKGKKRVDESWRIQIDNLSAMTRLMEKGVTRSDIDRKVIEDSWGYEINFWNGQQVDEDEATIDLKCGAFGPRSLNRVVLGIPNSVDVVSERDLIIYIYRLIVECYQPDQIEYRESVSMEARHFHRAPGPFIDWILYFHKTGLDTRLLPPGVTTQELGTHGTLFVLNHRPIDPYNREEMAKVKAVAALLGLNPMEPDPVETRGQQGR